jgi:hypothetical protein
MADAQQSPAMKEFTKDEVAKVGAPPRVLV